VIRKNLILIILVVLLLTVGSIIYFEKTPSQGKVLGTSIDSFYSQKITNIDPPPMRKSSVSDPKINAQSAVLIHESSMYPLYSKNADYQVPIASITKIMTAIVALENYKMEDVIEVSKENINVTPSVMNLSAGEKITVQNLLYGLLLQSGNDAALALASGKMPSAKFIELMNQKAAELGLEKTKFRDPAGLDDQGHSSAMDVAVLFSYALRKPEIEKIISTAEIEVSSVDKSEVHQLKNSNRLTTGEIPLDGVMGGKTGYTPDAGHTLVCAATRDGQTLISVVLKTFSNAASASATETRNLLVWGFESYNF